MEDRTSLLARVPLFAELSDEERQRIAELAETVEVGAGAELTHDGRYEGYYPLLVSGNPAIREQLEAEMGSLLEHDETAT